jgi:hypothetical protein
MLNTFTGWLSEGERDIWEALRDHTDILGKTAHNVGALMERVSELSDAQSAMSKKLELAQLPQTESVKRGRFGKLLVAIRGVFGA